MDEITNKGNSKLGHGIVRTEIFDWFGVIHFSRQRQESPRFCPIPAPLPPCSILRGSGYPAGFVQNQTV
jgi:hypothetical protein